MKLFKVLMVIFYMATVSCASKNIVKSERVPASESDQPTFLSLKEKDSKVSRIYFRSCRNKVYFTTAEDYWNVCSDKETFWANAKDIEFQTIVSWRNKSSIKVTLYAQNLIIRADRVSISVNQAEGYEASIILNQIQKCMSNLRNNFIDYILVTEKEVSCRYL